jgi:uncharacterized protein YbjT (DUF2867 family)
LRVAVLGGTGTAGRDVVAELGRRGHDAVPLSRAGGVDVVSGAGLAEGLAGADVVVDALQGGRDVLVDGVARALAAASGAGAGHFVSLSILGSDRVPAKYYKLKREQEAAVRDGGVPWSILRATQFHTLLDFIFGSAAKRGVLPLARVPIQPCDVAEVAVALADLVEAGPSNAVGCFAGPRVEHADQLARAWAHARGVRRLPVPIPAVGGTLRAVKRGGLTDPAAPHGTVSFADFLARPRSI